MFRIPLLFSVPFILAIGCNEYFNLEIPNNEEELVVEAFISTEQGAKVFLTHTIPIGDTLHWNEEYIVNGADVVIQEKQSKISETLIQNEDGFYISGGTLDFLPGNEYQLQINHELYGEVYSDFVKIPEAFETVKLDILQEKNYYEFLIEMIDTSSFVSDYSFELIHDIHYKDIDFLYPSNLYLDDCEYFSVRLGGYSNFYDHSCFISERINYVTKVVIDIPQPELKYRVSACSPEARPYFISVQNQPIGLDQIVLSPTLIQGNIHNGIGVFFGINDYIFEL